MAKINLLPWREERRKQLTQEFVRQSILVAIFAALVGGYGWYHVQGMIDNQKSRNRFLKDEIALLKEDIKEIKDIEQKKRRLIKRINVIQGLQQQRPQIVHLFAELASTVPNGLYLNSVTQKGEDLTLEGVANSNGRVSTYMRNLNNSSWLKSPQLQVIESDQENDGRKVFTLKLAQTTPEEKKNGSGNTSGGGS